MMLRSNCLKAKELRSILPICHSSLALLTPFTLYPSTDLFHGFRILQTLLMGQHVLLSPNGNKKLRALLQGTFLHRMFRFSSFEYLTTLIQFFYTEQAVYLRFSHMPIFSQNFIWALLPPPFWTENTPDSASSFRCSRTNLFWRKSP